MLSWREPTSRSHTPSKSRVRRRASRPSGSSAWKMCGAGQQPPAHSNARCCPKHRIPSQINQHQKEDGLVFSCWIHVRLAQEGRARVNSRHAPHMRVVRAKLRIHGQLCVVLFCWRAFFGRFRLFSLQKKTVSHLTLVFQNEAPTARVGVTAQRVGVT